MNEVQEAQAQPMPVIIEEDEITPGRLPVSQSTPVQLQGISEPPLKQAQSPQLDISIMQPAGCPDRGLYRVYYGWDTVSSHVLRDTAIRASIPDYEIISTLGQ